MSRKGWSRASRRAAACGCLLPARTCTWKSLVAAGGTQLLFPPWQNLGWAAQPICSSSEPQRALQHTSDGVTLLTRARRRCLQLFSCSLFLFISKT